MKKALIVIITILLLALINLIADASVSLLIGTISFFTLTTVLCLRFKKYRYLPFISLISLNVLVLLIGSIFKGISNTNFYGLINVIYLIVASILPVYLISLQSKSKQIIYLVSFTVLTIISSFTLPYLIENQLYFKTFTGQTNVPLKSDEVFLEKYVDGKLTKAINLKDNNKTYVIDFWNNNCGVCFQKFPLFDKLQQKYIVRNDLVFIAVNVYKEVDDIVDGNTLFKSQGHHFETYYIRKEDVTDFEIKGFPTTVVVNNNTITFKGTVETLDLLASFILK